MQDTCHPDPAAFWPYKCYSYSSANKNAEGRNEQMACICVSRLEDIAHNLLSSPSCPSHFCHQDPPGLLQASVKWHTVRCHKTQFTTVGTRCINLWEINGDWSRFMTLITSFITTSFITCLDAALVATTQHLPSRLSWRRPLSRASSPLASRVWSRPSPRLFSHVSCHICRPVSGNLSRHDPRHVSCRISRQVPRHGSPRTSLVTSIVTPLVTVSCHGFGHVLCHVCRNNSGPVSRHNSSCVSTRLPSQLRHISRPVFRGLSHVSRHDPTRVSCHISRYVYRHDFAISKCAPHHGKSNSTHPKCAEVSLCDLKMCTAPQRDRFDPPKVRRGFTLQAQNVLRSTAKAIQPIQSAQRVHFAISTCAPRHSESDSTVHFAVSKCAPRAARSTRPLKVLRVPQNVRSSWKVLRLPQNMNQKALKCCASHEICTNSSKVLRLSRKLALQRQSAQNAAPASKSEFDTLASDAEN